jgi:hypothetical protein
MMLLLVVGKPFNGDHSVDVAGWTQLAEFTDGVVAAGVDVGSMQATAYWKECSASESNPTLTEGATLWNVFGAFVMSFSKDASEAWEAPVIVGGGDSSAGTGFSVTAGSDPGVVAGDVCVCFAGFRSDAATPCSTHLVATQTGVTFGNTHDPATDPETTAGGDLGMCVNWATVTGTGSAAPVLAATLAAAHTGAAAFIRLRVAAGTPATVTPDPVALAVGMPAASPTVAPTRTPDPVALVTSVPEATEQAGATRTPEAVPLAVALPAPSAGVVAIVTPDPAALVAALPQAQPQAGATRTPAPTALVVALPGVSPSAGAQVTPATIAALAALPQAAAQAGAAATPTPAPVELGVGIPQVVPLAGGEAIAQPAPVALSVLLPQAGPHGEAVVVPATVALLADLPQAIAQAQAIAGPGTVAVVVALPQAAPFAGGVGEPGSVEPGAGGAAAVLVVIAGEAEPGASGGYADVDDG